MKHRPVSPRARALVTFAGTVVLAVLASVALLAPEVGVPAVESLTALPKDLNQLLPIGMPQ